MSIASEITRISGNIADAYTALDGKGATLPAAGSQNSANLADTIDTIATGSGGTSIFNEVDSIIDAVTMNTTYKNLYENGWWTTNSLQTSNTKVLNISRSCVVGYVLSEWFPSTIYIYNPQAIKIPDDASISYDTQTYWATVTFSQMSSNKYIIIKEDDYAENYILYSKLYLDTQNTSGSYCIGNGIRYQNIKMSEKGYSSASPYVVTSVTSSNSPFTNFELEDIRLSDNMKIAAKPTDLGNTFLCFPKSHHISLKDFFDNYVSDTTYGTFDLATVQSIGFLINSRLTFSNLLSIKDFPYILNCSSWGNEIKFCANGYDGATVAGLPPLNIKIILPSYSCYFYNMENGRSTERLLTPQSMQYMAENAPTVSSATLVLGANNIRMANAYDPTIITTLTSKGWTVSA